jgi:hypothetical protein
MPIAPGEQELSVAVSVVYKLESPKQSPEHGLQRRVAPDSPVLLLITFN